jgi:translation initiation factor IF-1
MVRNTHGGNKSKGMARKNFQTTSNSAQLRLPTDELEQIASVSKMLGNGMFYANTIEGTQLLCHIRNKFKGRSRRNNDVSIGKLVLIGLRNWENPIKNADLLFVYDDLDISTIANNFDLSSFHYDDNHLFTHFDHNNDHTTTPSTHTTTPSSPTTSPLHDIDIDLDLDLDNDI